jgi:hypothetical protein
MFGKTGIDVLTGQYSVTYWMESPNCSILESNLVRWPKDLIPVVFHPVVKVYRDYLAGKKICVSQYQWRRLSIQQRYVCNWVAVSLLPGIIYNKKKSDLARFTVSSKARLTRPPRELACPWYALMGLLYSSKEDAYTLVIRCRCGNWRNVAIVIGWRRTLGSICCDFPRICTNRSWR